MSAQTIGFNILQQQRGQHGKQGYANAQYNLGTMYDWTCPVLVPVSFEQFFL